MSSKPPIKHTNYIIITDGEGNKRFVRRQDLNSMNDAIKKQDSKKIVSAAMSMIVNSPDTVSELSKRIFMAAQIMNIKHPKQLKALKDMINYQLTVVKKDVKK